MINKIKGWYKSFKGFVYLTNSNSVVDIPIFLKETILTVYLKRKKDRHRREYLTKAIEKLDNNIMIFNIQSYLQVLTYADIYYLYTADIQTYSKELAERVEKWVAKIEKMY